MTPSNLCLARAWFRGVPIFLKCLHGRHSLLAGDLLDVFAMGVGLPKKDHKGSQARCPRSQVPGLMAALFSTLVYEAEAFLCQSLLIENTCLALAGSF